MRQLIKNSFLAIILLLTLQSCDDNETELLFNDVPAVRLEKQAKELQDLLKSSTDGWKATYFTDNTQLGGYSYLFKFTDNQIVEMASDFGGNDDVTSSQWALQIGSTLKLSFTTKNKIHDLSDSNNSPDADLRGQGYKGSFEFLYYGTEGDDIIFRTNRDFIELRFSKANADDWSNISTHKDIWESFPSSHLAYKIGNEISNFSYSNIRRFASNTDTNTSTSGFGVGFTPLGVTISPAIDVEGTLYSEFILSDDKSKLVSLDGNFEIEFIKLPFDLTVALRTLVDPVFASQSFIDSYNQVNAVHQTIFPQFPLSPIISLGDSNIVYGLGPFIARHGIFFSGILGSPDLLGVSKLSPGLNWQFVGHLNPMVDLIVDKAPYKVELLTPTVTRLTSESDPDFWFILVP